MPLIVSDLDHTLIEDPSQIPAAGEALRHLGSLGMTTVLASSKTFAEMEDLQREAGLAPQPFIFENGGGIGWPLAQWPTAVAADPIQTQGVYGAITTVRDLPALGRVLADLQTSGAFRFRRLDELPLDTAMALTGLDRRRARLALQRLTSLPLLWEDSQDHRATLQAALEPHGLQAVSGGRFVHVGPPCDKALALQQLRPWLGGAAALGPMLACGDSDNDRGILEAAAIALVFSDAQRPPLRLNRPSSVITAGGPAPWLRAVAAALETSRAAPRP